MDNRRGILPSFRELIVVVLLALPLLVTVSTIEAADWVDGLPSLKALVLVSLLFWVLLARSGIPWWVAHPLAALFGLSGAFVLGALTFAEGSGLAGLVDKIGSWIGAVGTEQGNRGTEMTGILLITVTLLMGHTTAWLAYRRPIALLAALPGLGVLLVVLTFLPSDYYWYFFMYLLAAAPGIAYRHQGLWSMKGQRVTMGSAVVGVALMAIAVAPAWRSPAPEGTVMPMASQFEEDWYSIRDGWSNLFYGVPDRKQWPFFSPPPDLPFLGPLEPEDNVLMEVKSEQPHRWRMRVYETYTSTGWATHDGVKFIAAEDAPLQEYVEDLKMRENVEITIRMNSKANALASVGEPLGVEGIPAKVELSPKPTFKMYLEGTQPSYLPPEVDNYRQNLVPLLNLSAEERIQRTTSSSSDLSASEQQVLTQSPNVALRNMGFRVLQNSQAPASELDQQLLLSGTPHMTLERAQEGPNPTLALLGQRVLVPYRQYKTEGSVSVAPGQMLREADTGYPSWVTDRYLQLTPNFPTKVKELAEEITIGQDNPYDKAEAIRLYLQNLPYSLDISVPPPGQDWVEHFLFTERRGYCQNYASAMITMLRSLGIPSRLAVGFAPGIYNQDRDVWVVLSRHYHAWPEVYFPEYGWVEFEPTPPDVQPALDELGIPRQPGLRNVTSDLEECIALFGIGVCNALDDLLEDDPDGPGEPEDFPTIAPVVVEPDVGETDFPISPWVLLGLGLGLALVVPVGTASYVRWGILRLGYPTVIYASMCFLGRLSGVGLRTNDTSWEYCSRLTRAFPEHSDPMERITRGYVITRYGPSMGLDAAETSAVRSAWRSIRGALLRRIFARPFLRRR